MDDVYHLKIVGHSKDDKTQSHERIVSAAAARIRESGTESLGVAEIMRTAGLTHGGFYKHFANREELIYEAIEHAMRENETAAAEVVSGADDPLAAFAEWYVSTAHRDDPANGCGVAALCTDVPRIGGPAQESYRAQVERYLARLHELLASEDPDARRRANVALSAMVGAVMIARGLGPTERSDELLRDVLEAIQARQLLPPDS